MSVGPLWADSASPILPGADDQIDSAHYLFVKSPLTSVADYAEHSIMRSNERGMLRNRRRQWSVSG